MKKATITTTILALALLLIGCKNEEITPEYNGDQMVSFRINNNTVTRLLGASQPAETVIFNSGDLYLVSAGGTIVRHFTISGNPTNVNANGNNIYIEDLRGAGVTIGEVPGQIRYVYIVGNTTMSPATNISQVRDRLLPVSSQVQQANGDNIVNLWGRAPLRRMPGVPQPQANGRFLYEAHDGTIPAGGMTLRPTVARVELTRFQGIGQIASFTVDGIFIDRFYRQAQVSGVTPAAQFLTRENVLPATARAAYFAIPTVNEYAADTGRAIHDIVGLNSDNRIVQAPNNQVWGYNLFSQGWGDTFSEMTPGIVVRLSNVVLVCNTPVPGVQFITIRGFRDYDPPHAPRPGIQAGNVYRINTVAFDLENLSPYPYQNPIDANVTVILAEWNGVNVSIPGFHQPSPLGREIDCDESWTFTLDPAFCGNCNPGTHTITYLWQQSTDRITWVAADTQNSANNLASGHFTTANLTETTYFRRLATCGCNPRTIGTHPARLEVDCPVGPFLTVTPYAIYIPQMGAPAQTVTVSSNLPTWAVTVVNGTGGAVITSPSWLVLSPSSPTGADNGTFTVNSTGSNTDVAARVATLRVKGECDNGVEFIEYVIVVQPGVGPGSGGPLQSPFVGAFWRNDQEGERLIRIPHGSGWTAIASHDWIMLDTEESADENVWNLPDQPQPANMSLDVNDLLHRLPATAGGIVRGNGEIYFRIGMRSRLPQGAMPRYGQGILTHNNNRYSHIIWIRQGEIADYLMEDVGDGARPYAVRFSPFNLTGASFGVVGYRGGIPAAYPSRAGAFWTWAGLTSVPPTAFAPIGGFGLSIIPTNLSWFNALSAVHESCPPGYRRPDTDNEFRQSLISNLTPHVATNAQILATNMTWGYYADGWFDRHGRTAAPAGGLFQVRPASSTVHGTGTQVAQNVAYIGRLFFNPRTNASLFFPATGTFRGGDNQGDLAHPAMGATYWGGQPAEASVNSPHAIGLAIHMAANPAVAISMVEIGTTGLQGDPRRGGNPIRCVRIP